MTTYDYPAIENALQKAYDLLKEELEVLKGVQANPNLIKEYENDMKLISEATEVVFRYEDLES